jgi:pimeloyl-ACP methyl ester carboxylesterase
MPVTIPQHAADCEALLDHLGVQRAHVVGQSYGGAVSLQLAVDAPATVQSLTLLEPALASALLGFPEFSKLLERAVELYASGRGREAIEQFGRAVVGGDRWDSFAAGWLERWVPDAAVLFESDIPSFSQWEFGEADAARIAQPVLNLRGSDTPAPFVEVWRRVNEWIPHAEGHVVQQASHCIMQMKPSRVAELLADFVDRHPTKQ